MAHFCWYHPRKTLCSVPYVQILRSAEPLTFSDCIPSLVKKPWVTLMRLIVFVSYFEALGEWKCGWGGAGGEREITARPQTDGPNQVPQRGSNLYPIILSVQIHLNFSTLRFATFSVLLFVCLCKLHLFPCLLLLIGSDLLNSWCI